jgi:hypothetical protein
MKITYTEFAADPALRGTTTNLPAHIAQVLIAQGVAKSCPMPPRGSAGWLAARKEQSALATAADPGDTVVHMGLEWGIQHNLGKPAIIKRLNSENYFYDVPPPECPRSIAIQFYDIIGRSEDPEAIRLRECEQHNQQQAQNTNEKKGVLATIFGRT